MAITLIDGFDTYNGVVAATGMATNWTIVNGNMTTGRFTGQGYSFGYNNGSGASRNLPAAVAGASMNFALKMTAATNTSAVNLIQFQSAGTSMVGISISALGAVEVYLFTSTGAGTLLGTSANGAIAVGAWNYLQLGMDVSDTVGTVNLKINGVVILALTNKDTRNGTPTTVDSVKIGYSGGFPLGTFVFDDMFFTDSSTLIGERRVETLYPTSDVAAVFARSTGTTNFSLVNEVQTDGDTTYVQSSTVGDTDTYGMQDLTGSPANISAVQVTAYARKTDATSRSIAMQIKSGATTNDGANFALASTFAKFERILETDPNTAAAWTAANVNALTGGPKVTV